jgi:alkylhydroperoxidase family enzyme
MRRALAALVIEIALITVWNRFNVTTRQVVGQFESRGYGP